VTGHGINHAISFGCDYCATSRRSCDVVCWDVSRRAKGAYLTGERNCVHPGDDGVVAASAMALGCSTGLYPALNARNVEGGVSSNAPSIAPCGSR
jgi:hypothetical protein